MVTVLIADDHEVVRRGVQSLLHAQPGVRVVGEAADGPEAIRAVERFKPDILLLDIVLPGMNGLDVAREITRRYPETRTIMLSMHMSETYVVDALRAADAGDIAVVVGGTIPEADVPKLLEAGAAAVFPTGTPLDTLVDEVRKLTAETVRD